MSFSEINPTYTSPPPYPGSDNFFIGDPLTNLVRQHLSTNNSQKHDVENKKWKESYIHDRIYNKKPLNNNTPPNTNNHNHPTPLPPPEIKVVDLTHDPQQNVSEPKPPPNYLETVINIPKNWATTQLDWCLKYSYTIPDNCMLASTVLPKANRYSRFLMNMDNEEKIKITEDAKLVQQIRDAQIAEMGWQGINKSQSGGYVMTSAYLGIFSSFVYAFYWPRKPSKIALVTGLFVKFCWDGKRAFDISRALATHINETRSKRLIEKIDRINSEMTQTQEGSAKLEQLKMAREHFLSTCRFVKDQYVDPEKMGLTDIFFDQFPELRYLSQEEVDSLEQLNEKSSLFIESDSQENNNAN